MMIVKNLFVDFQKQNLDISIVVKVACQKARKLLMSNGSDEHSKTLVLIDTVEDIDINNFNMVQFMALVGKVGALFSDGESGPSNGLLSTLLSIVDGDNHLPPLENLMLGDNAEHDH
jgi:hypothetical protein